MIHNQNTISQPTSEIESSLSELAKEITDLEVRFESLSSQLGPITRHFGCKGETLASAGACGVPMPPLSKVGETVHGFADRVNRVICKMNELMGNLAV